MTEESFSYEQESLSCEQESFSYAQESFSYAQERLSLTEEKAKSYQTSLSIKFSNIKLLNKTFCIATLAEKAKVKSVG